MPQTGRYSSKLYSATVDSDAADTSRRLLTPSCIAFHCDLTYLCKRRIGTPMLCINHSNRGPRRSSSSQRAAHAAHQQAARRKQRRRAHRKNAALTLRLLLGTTAIADNRRRRGPTRSNAAELVRTGATAAISTTSMVKLPDSRSTSPSTADQGGIREGSPGPGQRFRSLICPMGV